MKRAATAADRCKEPDAACTRPWYGKCDDGIERCYPHMSGWWWKNVATDERGPEHLSANRAAFRRYCEAKHLEALGGRPEVTVCSIQWCMNPAYCRGWCVNHYNHWRLYGDALKFFTPQRHAVFEQDIPKLLRGEKTLEQLGLSIADLNWLKSRYTLEDFMTEEEILAS
jgi:hypothetical protein